MYNCTNKYTKATNVITKNNIALAAISKFSFKTTNHTINISAANIGNCENSRCSCGLENCRATRSLSELLFCVGDIEEFEYSRTDM